MIQQIIVSAGAWFVPLCLFAGLAYAALLYFRERRYEFSASRRLVMGAIRAVVVSFIAFLLLSPFIKSSTKRTDDPVIIIAQDASASIVANKDSAFYTEDYPARIKNLMAALGQDYDVQTYSFGKAFREGIDFEYTDKQTNISEVLSELQSRYQNRNVGALILASDGIFNKGIHPHYALQYLSFPVYTIALGDTTPIRDAAIVGVMHNRIAYLNNTFTAEVHVRAMLSNGQNSTLRVLKDGQTVFTERIAFNSDPDNQFIPVELSADKPGLQRFRVEVLPVAGESLLSNNVKDIFVEVLEARQKILILYDAPHPDISAIRQTLELLENYEVVIQDASKYNGNPAEFNLVVLHQVPSVRQSHATLLRKLNEANLPLLHILGSGTDLNVFNTLAHGLTISGARGKTDETLPVLNPDFTLFTLSDEFGGMIRFFPPLYSPSGTYRESLAGNVLFYRQIGSLKTQMPLMMFSDFSGRKIGIIAGEGIWRWRMANFSRKGNHQAFNEWLGKSIQYLALREKRDRFMVRTQNTWNENDVIEFSAEFYNDVFEPVTTPEIELVISDEAGQQYPFAFSRSRNAYTLKTGQLPPGNYTYQATARQPGEQLEAKGAFTVLPLQIELTNTVADHRLMHGLAERYGGQMFYPVQLDELLNLIKNRGDVKPVFYFEKSYFELIDIKWLLFLIIALLTTEWIIRRIAGGY